MEQFDYSSAIADFKSAAPKEKAATIVRMTNLVRETQVIQAQAARNRATIAMALQVPELQEIMGPICMALDYDIGKHRPTPLKGKEGKAAEFKDAFGIYDPNLKPEETIAESKEKKMSKLSEKEKSQIARLIRGELSRAARQKIDDHVAAQKLIGKDDKDIEADIKTLEAKFLEAEKKAVPDFEKKKRSFTEAGGDEGLGEGPESKRVKS